MVSTIFSLVLYFTALCRAAKPSPDCAGVRGLSQDCSSNEAPYRRDFFYVGGRTVQNENGTFIHDSVYVERLSPVTGNKKKPPLVFFHGGGTSAVSWLNTPDNRSSYT